MRSTSTQLSSRTGVFCSRFCSIETGGADWLKIRQGQFSVFSAQRFSLAATAAASAAIRFLVLHS
jgi:hypothetical protein